MTRESKEHRLARIRARLSESPRERAAGQANAENVTTSPAPTSPAPTSPAPTSPAPSSPAPANPPDSGYDPDKDPRNGPGIDLRRSDVPNALNPNVSRSNAPPNYRMHVAVALGLSIIVQFLAAGKSVSTWIGGK